MRIIDAPEAWDITTGDGNVVVGIIDTGIDYNHPDLAPISGPIRSKSPQRIDDDNNGYVDDIHGFNFVGAFNPNPDPFDDIFHGTHVAGPSVPLGTTAPACRRELERENDGSEIH